MSPNELATSLAARRCEACQPGTPALSSAQIAQMLPAIPGWENRQDNQIAKTYKFQNYYETMAFVNAVAWISHREDHHPDMEVGYNKCTVRYSTHSIGGLSDNDFICASKIEKLFEL